MSRPRAQWSLSRGATVCDGAVRFSVWAPRAERVSLMVVDDGATRELPLDARGQGVFEGTVAGVAAGTDYLYRLDDARDRPDPVSRWQPYGVHGASRVVEPAAFRWSDQEWRGIEMADVILYELHVGAFTERGTFDGVAEHLEWLRALGITAIELMPVAEFPGSRNWGYDGAHLYAPQSTYGGPDGLKRLVDAAHRTGLAVFLDVVYNHLGPEGCYLPEFGPYVADRYRTPWGYPLNFDGPDSDEVRRYFVDNALFWITEYHIDGLRLDAADNIYDLGPRHFLEEIADAVHVQGQALGRRALVASESDLNDPRLLRPTARGGYEFDAQWLDDFHHAVHTALTGERKGYYVDFAGAPSIAKSLADRYVYDGRYSAYRRKRRGLPATDIPADHFIAFIQNHDQVGNRAGSDRLSVLASFEQCKLAAALLLLSPFVPLLFMGEEYGETAPFFFFVSHGDPALVEAVRRGRVAEFASFEWDAEIPDPQAEATMARSRLERARMTEPGHAQLLALYRDLLRVRREEPALRPGAARTTIASGDGAGWIALELAPPSGDTLLALFNVSPCEHAVPMATHEGTRWRVCLSTEAGAYGGRDDVAAEAMLDDAGTTRVVLPPWSAALYRQERA